MLISKLVCYARCVNYTKKLMLRVNFNGTWKEGLRLSASYQQGCQHNINKTNDRQPVIEQNSLQMLHASHHHASRAAAIPQQRFDACGGVARKLSPPLICSCGGARQASFRTHHITCQSAVVGSLIPMLGQVSAFLKRVAIIFR